MHIPDVSQARPQPHSAAQLSCLSLWACCGPRRPSANRRPFQPIQLPKPQITAGLPLMRLWPSARRREPSWTGRFPCKRSPILLWAAFWREPPRDVKPELGRTAPSAMNSQDIELDVVLAEGVYVYEAEANRLRPILAGDVRGKIGTEAATHAAVTIVYVANAKDDWAQVDTGFIGQNVYLFAASEGLNAWFYAFHGQNRPRSLKAARRKTCALRAIGRLPAK